MPFSQQAEALFLTICNSSFASLKVTVAKSPSPVTAYPWLTACCLISSDES